MTKSDFAKKTKAEILDEYNKLLEQQQELKLVSKQVHEPANQELLAKTKIYDTNHIHQTITTLKTTFNTSINQLADLLLAEAQKLQDLQRAIELSRQTLQTNYNIQVAAEALGNLIAEYETKERQLGESSTLKKRDWEREQEEYLYNTKLGRKREQELFDEQLAKKENDLKQREQIIKNQELEIASFKKQISEQPLLIEKEVKVKEKEILEKLQAEYDNKSLLLQKEWEARTNLQTLEIKNLKDILERQSTEIIVLKKETELANKKAQELALKVVESATAIGTKKEATTLSSSS